MKNGKLAKWIRAYKTPYLFIAPFFILFFTFQLLPMMESLYYSFTDYDGMNTPKFVGFRNFAKLFNPKNYAFYDSIRNTFIYWIVCSVLIIMGAFLVALLLNARRLAGRTFVKTAAFIPYVCASVALALVFKMLFDYNSGLINSILEKFGFEKVGWLTTSAYSKIPVICLFVWRMIPWYCVIMLSGLLSIPQEYYEVSRIDGGTLFSDLKYITIPLMKNIFFFCFITTTCDTWKMFNEAYMLKGPAYSNATLFQYMYENAFSLFKLGYASSIGVVLSVIMIIISFTQFRLRAKQEQEYGR